MIPVWRSVVAATGLVLFAGVSKADEKTVTFAKDVAVIFQEKCQDCHHKGSMAPMSLVTYEETRPWAKSIRERVLNRQMPPWHIDKTVGIQHFENDRSILLVRAAEIGRCDVYSRIPPYGRQSIPHRRQHVTGLPLGQKKADTRAIVKAVKTREPERRSLPVVQAAARAGCC